MGNANILVLFVIHHYRDGRFPLFGSVLLNSNRLILRWLFQKETHGAFVTRHQFETF